MLGFDSSAPKNKFLEQLIQRSKFVTPYELLPLRNAVDTSHDPEVTNYFSAKALYDKGVELCQDIPQGTDDATLDSYEEQIRTASEILVDAWLMDYRATPMSERILLLGQQYEQVLLKLVPEEQKAGFYVKYSLLFSSWILLIGYKFKDCLDTLSVAISKYPDLPIRVYFIRASCYFSLNNEGSISCGIKDLERAVTLDPGFYIAYFLLGTVYVAIGNQIDHAITNFVLYLERSNPSSLDTIQSLYALTVLYDNKNEKHKSAEFYKLAVAAEVEFTKIYGTHTGLSNLKRIAVYLHEEPEEANALTAKYTLNKLYDKEIREMVDGGNIILSYPPNPDQCSSCGKKDSSVLACSACKSIWYCSRDCQVADYRKTHRDQCATMREE